MSFLSDRFPPADPPWSRNVMRVPPRKLAGAVETPTTRDEMRRSILQLLQRQVRCYSVRSAVAALDAFAGFAGQGGQGDDDGDEQGEQQGERDLVAG